MRLLYYPLLALGLLPSVAVRAQTVPLNPEQPWGSWLIGTVVLSGAPGHRWDAFAEVQARTNGVLSRLLLQ